MEFAAPATSTQTGDISRLDAAAPAGRFRWIVCGLLFFATTINYMDRQVIGILKPLMHREMGWTETDYANIVASFQFAYFAGGLIAGLLIDRIGVRIGYAVSVALWSLASMAHGLARTVFAFSSARVGLGLAEAGNFPAAVKTVGEWFPPSQRALATGIFNAGSNVGAMITPLIVPHIVTRWGWKAAFYLSGLVGFCWLLAWVSIYRVSPIASRDMAISKTPRMSLVSLLSRRSTVAYGLSGMFTGPVWWFYLFWTPDFLNKKFGLDLVHLGLPLAIIYLMSDAGSIGGGWISSHLMKRGFSVNFARKSAMLLCALAVVPVCTVSYTSSPWLAAFLIGLAAAAHQGWSANLFTFVTDTAPTSCASTIVSLGGLPGGIAGIVSAKLIGHTLQVTGNYHLLFAVASMMYLIALLVLHALVPRISNPAGRN